MPKHLTEQEAQLIEKLHKQKKTPSEILTRLQTKRAKKDADGPSTHAVYRVLKGETHTRGQPETRGAKSKLPARCVATANAQRRRLIKEAQNNHIVTWEDIHGATQKVLRARGSLRGGARMPAADYLARLVRSKTPVRARPPKQRINRTKTHEQQRHEQALVWREYGKSFWIDGMHVYIDNKAWVVPCTVQEKKRIRARRVHQHLRTPAEGGERGFVLGRRGL